MINEIQKRILILALFAGEIMLKSGAEIYRVEDTITRICRSCKVPFVECFATTTGIFLSLDSGKQYTDMHTFIKRIKSIDIDLMKISRVNEFSREFISTGNITLAEGFTALQEIDSIKPYNLLISLLGAMLVGAPLCMSFGGTYIEAGFCAVITGLAYLVSRFINRLMANNFIRIFISCFVCGFLALLISLLPFINSFSFVVMAAVTLFLPGVAITNAARDILSGDMLAGVARFAEALLIAIAIAGSVGTVVKVWSLAGGNIPIDTATTYPLFAVLLFAFFTTFGFCLIFHVPKKHIILSSVIGALGFLLYHHILNSYDSVLLASFFGASLVAVLAEFSSRAGKDVTTIFIIPGIIPLVPGTGMYLTMLNIINGDLTSAASIGIETLFVAGSIGVAIVLVASFTRILMAIIRRITRFVLNRKSGNNKVNEENTSADS